MFPYEDHAQNMYISVKHAAPRRTYLHKQMQPHILSDKSNTAQAPSSDTLKSKSKQSNDQKTQSIDNEPEKYSITKLIKRIPSKKALSNVAVPISKLRKKKSLQKNIQLPADTGKKRNLSTSYLIGSGREKNNPHIDINDLPLNILDDFSSFQHISPDEFPVATSTPKETKHTGQQKQQLLDTSENVLQEISPLTLPASAHDTLKQDMPNLALLSLDLKKPVKESTKKQTKAQTKQIMNRLKNGGTLVKHLPQPITCDSSLDDEIITTFS
ncbi:hypothetical protein PORY_001497 [Pneumocystis oryctolagi]|uniref:Uncharacterized protein n=1 Tax=Pneumocystis oryctolagi TaxID=42067 RepID=A0ACB7CC51_9ASCO|nr:hypothetical protein PORY_001497 [Pneumocystis oryctolagi]